MNIAERKYRVGYVDESKNDIVYFHDFMAKYDSVIEVIDFIPESETIDKLYQKINNEKLDILVVDYRLNEYSNINFQGSDLIDYLHQKRRDFPCILLTSHPYEALDYSLDSHIVYDKEIIIAQSEQDDGDIFFKKIKKSIEKYINQLNEAEKTINELNNRENLSIEEENSLLLSDEFIEANLGIPSVTPRILKTENHNKELKQLIDEVQRLLNELQ